MVIRPIADMVHDGGFAYRAVTRHPELSSDRHPSAAAMLEDGVPLPGPANALHDDIRVTGRGRYSFWYNVVYFAASDNSDPRTNGRRYSISFTQTWMGRLASLLPYRLSPTLARAGARGLILLERVRTREAVWGALYWLCFAYALGRGRVAAMRGRS